MEEQQQAGEKVVEHTETEQTKSTEPAPAGGEQSGGDGGQSGD